MSVSGVNPFVHAEPPVAASSKEQSLIQIAENQPLELLDNILKIPKHELIALFNALKTDSLHKAIGITWALMLPLLKDHRYLEQNRAILNSILGSLDIVFKNQLACHARSQLVPNELPDLLILTQDAEFMRFCIQDLFRFCDSFQRYDRIFAFVQKLMFVHTPLLKTVFGRALAENNNLEKLSKEFNSASDNVQAFILFCLPSIERMAFLKKRARLHGLLKTWTRKVFEFDTTPAYRLLWLADLFLSLNGKADHYRKYLQGLCQNAHNILPYIWLSIPLNLLSSFILQDETFRHLFSQCLKYQQIDVKGLHALYEIFKLNPLKVNFMCTELPLMIKEEEEITWQALSFLGTNITAASQDAHLDPSLVSASYGRALESIPPFMMGVGLLCPSQKNWILEHAKLCTSDQLKFLGAALLRETGCVDLNRLRHTLAPVQFRTMLEFIDRPLLNAYFEREVEYLTPILKTLELRMKEGQCSLAEITLHLTPAISVLHTKMELYIRPLLPSQTYQNLKSLYGSLVQYRDALVEQQKKLQSQHIEENDLSLEHSNFIRQYYSNAAALKALGLRTENDLKLLGIDLQTDPRPILETYFNQLELEKIWADFFTKNLRSLSELTELELVGSKTEYFNLALLHAKMIKS